MTSDATECARKLIAPYSERIEALEQENQRLYDCLSDDAEYAKLLMEKRAGDDVLRAIDQLRRDLAGYHGQMKAHDDLQRHCDNQRRRIVELERLYAGAKAERDEALMAYGREDARANVLMGENAKLRELVRDYHMFEHGDCHSCRYYDECRKDESCCCIAKIRLAERVRELGIEVNDG